MVELNGTLLVQSINFFILVAILAKFAYKPLLKVMEARSERIARDLTGAEEAKAKAEALRVEYEAQLADARREAQMIIEKAVKQAEADSQAQIKELREQLAREKEQARQDIVREREKAMRQLREEVVTLSVAIAGKVVAKEIDSKANAALINDAIEKLDGKAIGL